jgi:hypothetical protein
MQILVELRDNTTLQIPFREVSKVLWRFPDFTLVANSSKGLAVGWRMSSPKQTPKTRTSLATDYGWRFFLC